MRAALDGSGHSAVCRTVQPLIPAAVCCNPQKLQAHFQRSEPGEEPRNRSDSAAKRSFCKSASTFWSLRRSWCNDEDDVLRITSAQQRDPKRRREKSNETRRQKGRGAKGGRSASRPQDSPVGVRGLVNDVLVGGEQDQSVLAEIHSHVCLSASIQTAADGERHGMRLQSGEEEEEEAVTLTGGDKETSGVRRVLAPEHYRPKGLMGPRRPPLNKSLAGSEFIFN